MKKIFMCMICLFTFISCVNANEIVEVKFDKCVDGDTAYFLVDGVSTKFRFLAIDTPETKHPSKPVEEFGKDASEYTCTLLTNAKKIEVEYDDKSDKKDKYNRDLAFIYIDGELLEEKLISVGYAEVAYIYGKYQHVEDLCEVQANAILNKYGIWADGSREEGYCKSGKNNSTSTSKTETTVEKTTTKTSDADDFIDIINYTIDGKYEKALKLLIKKYSYTPVILILIISYIIFLIIKKGKKRK